MPVAATPSRARNPKIEAVNWSGTVNASTQSATWWPSLGADPAELESGHDECCGRRGRRTRVASGPAIGRKTMRVRPASSSLRGRLSADVPLIRRRAPAVRRS